MNEKDKNNPYLKYMITVFEYKEALNNRPSWWAWWRMKEKTVIDKYPEIWYNDYSKFFDVNLN
jgi:hypothetical protein